MKKLTFKEWYDGDVTLQYAKFIYKGKEKKEDKEDKPELVSWDDFSDEDVDQIKKKQKEIFHEIIKLRLDKLKVNFKESYNRSQIKGELLEIEKQECINILSAPIPQSQKIISKEWNVLFELDDLLNIQYYFKNVILGGNDDGYDFIQSPNDKYQDITKTPSEAYAQLLFDYFQWLDDSFKSLDENSDQEKNNKSKKRDKTKMLWFQVGLLFANGEMDRLINRYQVGDLASYAAISKELGNENFRPYISESIHGSNKNDKNIFSDRKKLQSIIDYCESEGISIIDSFTMRMNKYK
ncbi:hypothetical protein [Psychroserpens mesophilus]|uniref:hypothetical protein n=1 Tax=Psychroserpens mesophilus TaxID=325473 RepID=UPI0005903F0A|nr:hypothetical protein [Psychroserpens mesophilus]